MVDVRQGSKYASNLFIKRNQETFYLSSIVFCIDDRMYWYMNLRNTDCLLSSKLRMTKLLKAQWQIWDILQGVNCLGV